MKKPDKLKLIYKLMQEYFNDTEWINEDAKLGAEAMLQHHFSLEHYHNDNNRDRNGNLKMKK